MQKGLSFWKKDWIAGLIITLGLLFVWASTDVIEDIERYAYDLGVQASAEEPGDKVAIIAIDDQSIENLGRWPWPRTCARPAGSRMRRLTSRGWRGCSPCMRG